MASPILTRFLDLHDRHFGRYKQFLKFSIVGVANTLIDLGVFSLLFYGLGAPILMAHIAGFLMAGVNSYICNRSWTFRDSAGTGSTAQMARFFIVAVAMLALSSVLLLVLKNFLPVLIAKMVVIACTVIASYLANKVLVFAGQGKEAAD